MALKNSKKYGYKIQLNTLKNGDTSYYAVYKIKDKTKFKKVGLKSEGLNETKAFYIRSQIISQLRNGLSANAKTFNDIAKAYFYAIKHKKSYRLYKNIYAKHIAPALGDLKLSKVTDKTLDKLRASLIKENLSNGTTKQIMSLVARIANFALKRGYIEQPLIKDIKYPIVANTRERYLTTLEIKQLKKALQKDALLLLFIEIALQTGARAKSILSLQKKDIDLQNNTIKMYDYKSEKSYISYLHKDTMETVLKKVKNKPDGCYIVSRTCKRYKYIALYKRLQPILDTLFNKDTTNRANKVVIHTLRHTFASHLAINGVPIQEIKKLMNHSDIKMTLKYAKLMPNSGREYVKDLYE